jgi:hypothetical protein
MSNEAGWWGCLSCRTRVGNGHSGPCTLCGGRIGRVVPGTQLNLDFGIKLPRREIQPPPVEQQPPRDWTNVALVAAVVSCLATPLLGASSAGWSAVVLIMALNIWSSSISYYALALVGRREHQQPVPVVEPPVFQPFKLAPELYQPRQLPRRRAA